MESQAIWNWLLARDVSIVAIHLPGSLNSQADFLSRDFVDTHDWSLNDKVALNIFQAWGMPDTDLFVDEVNAKCPVYASRFPQ